MALVHIHQLATGVLDSSRGCVDAYKHTDIEVHAERHHWHYVAFIPVGMALQCSAK